MYNLIIRYLLKEMKSSSEQNKNDIKVNAQVSKDENSMKCKMLKVNGT